MAKVISFILILLQVIYLPLVMNSGISMSVRPEPGTYTLGFPDMMASVTMPPGELCMQAWIAFDMEPSVYVQYYHLECVNNNGVYYATPLISLYGPTTVTNVKVCVWTGETYCRPFPGTWIYKGVE